MFLARRPSPQHIDRFLRESQDLPLSYGPIGIVKANTERQDVGETTVAIGHGTADFERARAALLAWQQFNIGWVETFPRHAPVATGTVVAVLIRHVGFWSLNGCRVLYAIGGLDDAAGRPEGPKSLHLDSSFRTDLQDVRPAGGGAKPHCGFAYGTLTNHAESGEELFEVFIDSETGEVLYRIRAISWPQATLAHVGQPIVRLLQARFRRHSAEAMQCATGLNGGRA